MTQNLFITLNRDIELLKAFLFKLFNENPVYQKSFKDFNCFLDYVGTVISDVELA